MRHAEGCALRGADAARALTVGAYLGRCAGGAARTLTVGAGLNTADGDLLLAAEGGLLKAHVELDSYVIALARRVRVAACAASAKAEYVAGQMK